jgi:large subunit ribosomal protein L18
MMNSHKNDKLTIRKLRVRNKIHGTAAKPRLAVTRSNSNIYAQIIDDDSGQTLVACSTFSKKGAAKAKAEGASTIGKLLAQRAAEKGITQVVFDRRGRQYHGRLALFASAAREAGLKF